MLLPYLGSSFILLVVVLSVFAVVSATFCIYGPHMAPPLVIDSRALSFSQPYRTRAVSRIPYLQETQNGNLVYRVKEMHDGHREIFRIAPKEPSFTNAGA